MELYNRELIPGWVEDQRSESRCLKLGLMPVEERREYNGEFFTAKETWIDSAVSDSLLYYLYNRLISYRLRKIALHSLCSISEWPA